MSYKHNNLLAMRERYWQNHSNEKITQEKQSLILLLQEHDIFAHANADDAKYLFFSLSSDVILQGYAHGFCHPTVQVLIIQHILRHKTALMQRQPIKVRFGTHTH